MIPFPPTLGGMENPVIPTLGGMGKHSESYLRSDGKSNESHIGGRKWIYTVPFPPTRVGGHYIKIYHFVPVDIILF